ncbi:MAG: peptide deformylase [bacterium]|nr:peptide deformylase [bacterium]
MIIRKLTQVGNPILKQKTTSVKNIKAEKVQQIINDLVDSMRHHKLVGIAAPQIGWKLRIFITELRKTPVRSTQERDKLRIFINPKIIGVSKKQIIRYEGCGSVAYGLLFGPVKRPEKITIEAQNDQGKKFKMQANGSLARVIQHEYDHLEGVVFTIKITDIGKIMSREEYIKSVKKTTSK